MFWKLSLTAACWFAQELHAELAWYDENATLAAERASWFMVRGFSLGRLRSRAASFCQAATAHLCCDPLPQDAYNNCCSKMSALVVRMSRP